MRYFVTLFLIVSLFPGLIRAQTPEQKTARYFDSIRNQPPLMLAFLHDMPKGGDLHNHLDGALYAEDIIDWAVSDNLCVDRTTSRLLAPPCDACEHYTPKPMIRCAYDDHILYNQVIDAWSMRNWRAGEESGHDHFFATFDKFGLATHNHVPEAIASVMNRAAKEHVQYIEFMHTADGRAAAQLGQKLGLEDDLGKMREKLLSGGLKEIVVATSKSVLEDESRARSNMKCGTPQEEPGCGVSMFYLYQVLRGLPREAVFAQMVLGFELASFKCAPEDGGMEHLESHNPIPCSRFVGLNLVMPEDWYVPIHDFNQHMAMLDYLHTVYPKIHISLHAGEIAEGLVKPEDLSFHIRASIEKGHAERIGHGVDVMLEKDPIGLMKEMATRNVMVEINLTSNDEILGVSGNEHPLPVYLKYGVPVALSSDDEGVARSDMTHEYFRAVESYHLPYTELKRMTRQSLAHSFLTGESLWIETQGTFKPNPVCAADIPPGKPSTASCLKFLIGNDRAQEQWKLEAAFAEFEKKF